MFPEPVLEWVARPLTFLFLTAACVLQRLSVFSGVQYVTVPMSVWAVWSPHCDTHTHRTFFSSFYSFWTKKHTVETFPLYGSWLAFADFYNELSIIVINIVISSIIEYLLHSTQSYMMCSATTLVWKHL